MPDPRPLPLARDLWRARRDGQTISTERDDLPRSLAQAYAVQRAVAALSGAAKVGWKIGSTSAAAQRLLGVDEPACAPLLAPFVHSSPARIRLGRGQQASVEGEFAFRFGTRLPPRAQPYEREEITRAIEAVCGAIEVVGTRFEGGLAGKGRYLTTADCGVNVALVLGSWVAFDGEDLRDHPVAMRINGVTAGSGSGAAVLGDPLNALSWLANRLSRDGLALERGAVVATGTCTGLDPVRPGDAVRAEFGAFGAVALDIAPGA
jgi:2-keto-4-pentenoate hydratase